MADEESNVISRPGYDALWGWFGLSYASFLTLPRVLMHEMHDEWQADMARLLHEYYAAFPNQPPVSTVVNIKRRRNNRFMKTPEWLVNYRHPDREMIARLRDYKFEWED
jgi:hypothetical protein